MGTALHLHGDSMHAVIELQKSVRALRFSALERCPRNRGLCKRPTVYEGKCNAAYCKIRML